MHNDNKGVLILILTSDLEVEAASAVSQTLSLGHFCYSYWICKGEQSTKNDGNPLGRW